MRYPIWKKDDFFAQGPNDEKRVDMDPEVVTLPEKAALSWGFNWNTESILGEVTDIRLEDGEITGEVRWFVTTMDDEKIKDLECRLAGYYTEVFYTSGNKKRVKTAYLKGVAVIQNVQTPGFGANPGATINKED